MNNYDVLMHLLVSGAFWRSPTNWPAGRWKGLNAPSGAGGFLAVLETGFTDNSAES